MKVNSRCTGRLGARICRVTVLAYLGFGLVIGNAAIAADTGDSGTMLEWPKFIVSILGLAGALVVFVVGLTQYRQAQQWKRAEFVANEFKELQQDRRATTALTMIDWASREIKLHAAADPTDQQVTRVTREMQCLALRPHTFSQSAVDAGGAFEVSRDGAQLRAYTSVDALIRDCYDGLLDRYDRLGGYLASRLLTTENLAPYVGYYVNDIAKPTDDPAEAMWCVCFLTYVHFYNFTGVRCLFSGFGHDISPSGTIFRGFVTTVAQARQTEALQLQQAAQREYENSENSAKS